MEMLTLSFSYNWNNKLDCKAFTTIRIYNPENHVPDKPVSITLKGIKKCTGLIKGCKRFLLADLNEYMAYLDTGYNKEECTKVIERMYPSVDFKVKKMALLLILKDK